ncbi:MAG: hypothetical protein Tsb0020_25570 [Haliangiales bacterium]
MPAKSRPHARQLRLRYRPPYDWDASLRFLAARAMAGVERVRDGGYERTILVSGVVRSATANSARKAPTGPTSGGGAPAWLRVTNATDESALNLTLWDVPARAQDDIVGRIRRMFGLDTDPDEVRRVLGRDRALAPHLERWPGMRIPGGWDGYEIAVRAILGQQVSVAAARTLAARLVARFGSPAARPPSALDDPAQAPLTTLFPEPGALAVREAADLSAIGLSARRALALRDMTRALLSGEVALSTDDDDDGSEGGDGNATTGGPERGADPLAAFTKRWVALPGIGPWTAHYIALRGLCHRDAFPAGDLILRRAANPGGDALTERALTERARAWRPWRAYAAVYLWRSVVDPD